MVVDWGWNDHHPGVVGWDNTLDRLGAFHHRVEANPGVEVILALGSDVEGEATANYIAEALITRECHVTRIAQGLPAGGGLDHADDLTLMRALQGRRKMGE